MSEPLLPVLPALRWSGGDGFGLERPEVRRWLDQGVAGFILFGGTATAAREASELLRERAGRALLLGADLERGVGQQFQGATALPPLAALAAAGDRERLFQAGAMTGREARAVGVPWVFAPVADLAVEPRNPIVGTRSPGADPVRVARAVAAWIEGCLSQGALPCVKHFPGHGRTVEDSHRALPVVAADRDTLSSSDWVPFRAAIQAGVPAVMTAHVAYPALDASGRPATRSRPILTDLLRDTLGFGGVVVTDALIMDGVGDGATAAVEALQAGVDLLLYPPSELPVGKLLQAALADGRLDPGERAESLARVQGLLARTPRRSDGEGQGWGGDTDQAAALRWATGSLETTDWRFRRPDAVSLAVVDDDVGGPYPAPSREVFPAVLREAGIRVVEDFSDPILSGPHPSHAETAPLPILCVYSEPRGWKGRAGLSAEAEARVRRWADHHGAQGGVVAFGGPTLQAALPSGLPILLAWGGEALMQRAAAGRIAG